MIMNERLLHFIWQMQYYNPNELATVSGEPIKVLKAGTYNTDQGPDFQQARVRIRQTTWAGNVELHLRTSDWYKHRHQQDKNYDNVILHVVWQHDAEHNGVPVLELADRVPRHLLQRFEDLMQGSSFIPCAGMIGKLDSVHWHKWNERMAIERLSRKAEIVNQFQLQNKGSWEETCWWMLARNFGYRVNMQAFEEMARSLPLTILSRHRFQIVQLEALLMGQAGLLKEKINDDDYYSLLQREYRFLKEKYGLQEIRQSVYFLRMRPGNFPTLRLAQLAALIHQQSHLFSQFRENGSIQDVRDCFDVLANDYWHYHYRFGEKTNYREKRLGAAMTDSILINTLAPLLFAYGDYHQDEQFKERAIRWLEKTTAENHSITQGFKKLGVEYRNAFDTQALTELKNEYCDRKRCLECGIGNALLKGM